MSLNYQYAAGLFDGEGWCSIKRARASLYGGRRDWAYQCRAEMTLRERSILELFHTEFGGTLNEVKSRSENHSTYYHWHVSGKEAMFFALAIEDKAMMKGEQLRVLASFQREKGRQGNQPLGDGRYEFYTSCFDRMKLLNAKGVGKI